MEFEKVIKERYSVRKFKEEKIDKETIDKILEAGLLAPTGKNNQPHKILVINSEEALNKLKECSKCHFDAPLAFLICYNKDECWQRPYDGELSGVIDASIVTTHLMLQAKNLGIGSCWVMHFDPFKMREAFNIPENIIPTALLVMGEPDSDSEPSERHLLSKPIEDIVLYDTF